MAKYGPLEMMAGLAVLTAMGGWCVLLGGASAIQNQADPITALLNQNSGVATYLDIQPMNSPQRVISYEWFKAVFQILTLLFIAFVLATGQVSRFRAAMVGLLAVLASLWCDACQTLYYIHLVLDSVNKTTPLPKIILYAVRSYFAGCIISATMDLGLIIILGIGLGHAIPATDAYAFPKDPNHPVTTAAGSTGTI